MRTRLLLAVLLLASVAPATRMWTEQEFEQFHRSYRPEALPRPESLIHGPRRFNYLERVKLTCDFVQRYQVSDSLSPDFGGIIEAEHMPNVIESDNTHEAIWIWSRWYELTGWDDYRESIRRAWVYILHFPAFREHGGQQTSIWYAVWNCGLGFIAESQYRRTFGDSSFRFYADTCRTFYLNNKLPELTPRDWFVTGQAAGMAYDYAVEHNDAVLRDTALARGNRTKAWIEGGARTRLAYTDWAMSGGTAFWGVAHTFCRNDTVAGKAWLDVYTDSLPGFYPGGTWNCSHNIWLANAYRASAELGHDTLNWMMHHYLVDTLLMKDTDRDGGIPATWTDPSTQDQTWVSTYLDFMGMDVFVTPTYDRDLAVLEFTEPDRRRVYTIADSIPVSVPLANVGRTSVIGQITLRVGGYQMTRQLPVMFLGTDTVYFGTFVSGPGILHLEAFTEGDSNPHNDSVQLDLKVYGIWNVSGTLLDSTTGEPVRAWVKGRIQGNTAVWDSCETDSAGTFLFHIIDTSITVSIEPEVPYFDRSWDLAIHGDTTINLVTQPAHVLVVNNDSASRYESYYTTALDTLGLTWCVWPRRTGAVPWAKLDRFRLRALVYYSGDTRVGTVPSEDRDSLVSALGRGVDLLLTGQNIAEELAGTPFFENTIGCRFDSSGWAGFFAFGDRTDSLGAFVTGISTAAGNGANNQTSRDVVSPLGNSTGFLVYDSVAVRYAGTRRELPGSHARVVFLGFGFEAANRPNPRPTYFTRSQLMGLILGWFGAPVGIAEGPRQTAYSLQPTATIVRGVLFLPEASSGLSACGLAQAGKPQAASLLDAAGRKVVDLKPGANDLQALSPGVYFVRSNESNGSNGSYRLIVVR